MRKKKKIQDTGLQDIDNSKIIEILKECLNKKKIIEKGEKGEKGDKENQTSIVKRQHMHLTLICDHNPLLRRALGPLCSNKNY